MTMLSNRTEPSGCQTCLLLVKRKPQQFKSPPSASFTLNNQQTYFKLDLTIYIYLSTGTVCYSNTLQTCIKHLATFWITQLMKRPCTVHVSDLIFNKKTTSKIVFFCIWQESRSSLAKDFYVHLHMQLAKTYIFRAKYTAVCKERHEISYSTLIRKVHL